MVSQNVSQQEVCEQIKKLVGELLAMDPETISDDDRLLDLDIEEDSLGLDSLDSLQLALGLAKEYEIYEKVEVEWERVTTVKDLAFYICEILHVRSNGSAPH